VTENTLENVSMHPTEPKMLLEAPDAMRTSRERTTAANDGGGKQTAMVAAKLVMCSMYSPPRELTQKVNCKYKTGRPLLLHSKFISHTNLVESVWAAGKTSMVAVVVVPPGGRGHRLLRTQSPR